jgi:hypothetical protein
MSRGPTYATNLGDIDLRGPAVARVGAGRPGVRSRDRVTTDYEESSGHAAPAGRISVQE